MQDKTMRAFEGLLIITGIYFLGQIISSWLPIPLPGNIVGLLLMVFGLLVGVIPVERVEVFAYFLLDNLILVFIPLSVSVITIWPIIKAQGLAIFAVNIVTTVAVLVATGLSMNFFKVEEAEENIE